MDSHTEDAYDELVGIAPSYQGPVHHCLMMVLHSISRGSTGNTKYGMAPMFVGQPKDNFEVTPSGSLSLQPKKNPSYHQANIGDSMGRITWK